MTQERAAWTREGILQAAAETFETRGYLGTSLRDIVTRRDVSKGALYFHFQSKEALAIAVVQEHYEKWTRVVTEIRAQHHRAIQLMLELSWQTAQLIRDEAVMRAGIRLLAERKLIGPSVPRPFVDWIGVIEELLDEARAQHDLLPDVGIKETARIIVAALTGLHQISYAQGGCTDPRACVSTMWHCLLPGIVTLGCLADMRAIVAGFGDDS